MSNRVLAGRYELLEKIGDGGMAVVYKARCRLLNRLVAIKILKPAYSKDAKFIENFRRESQAAASLTHPNIVGIYDVGREGSINFIVMELVEGKTLADLIRQEGPMAPREAVRIARQICSALSHAHKHQIIHRDVKPHNILLTSDGTAKITDFGIAKAVDMGTVVGNTGMVLGSVHYLSPEQARGGYVDEKTDIYSMGIMLYEMLTGQVPFDADNPVAVAVKHMNEEITPPSRLVDTIPQELEEVVMKATQKYPVNRYLTADAMLEALQNASLSTIGIFSGPGGYTGKATLDATMMMDMINGGRRSGAINIGDVETLEDGTSVVRLQHGEEDEKEQETGETKKQGILERIGIEEFMRRASSRTRTARRTAAPKETTGKVKASAPKSGKKKGGLGWVRFAAVALAIVLAFPLSSLLAPIFEEKEPAPVEVEVPGFQGKTLEEAETLAEEMGLKIKVGQEVSSYDYKAGQIVSQAPKEGNVIKTGQTITVNISKGVLASQVPDVRGKNESDAKFMLESYGFVVGTVKQAYSNTVPEGRVCDQSVDPGEEAKTGTTINLTISKGKEVKEVKVPDLKGLTKTEVTEKLFNSGLKIGKVSYGPSAAYAEGLCISQSVKAGDKVTSDTKIDVVLSNGPDETSGEGAVIIKIDYSKAQNEVLYLTVIVSDETGVGRPIDNEQRLKSTGTEEITLTGTGTGTVTVLFDNVKVAEYTIDYTAGTVN
ncbi:MAG: Stk1 family PASTA domain-containing Ser/Thr kinase [Clostridiales bacterium]|nr:Stk1 family PASTA domain-containing Ser/Thr kinase [Clostridiales bacterium]